MTSRGRSAASGQDQDELATLCQQAVATIEQSLAEPPAQLGKDADRAERLVARLRDGLIEQLHRGGDQPGLRSSLDRVNAALSLIVGVEYPSGGIQREDLEHARDLLKSALGGAPSSTAGQRS